MKPWIPKQRASSVLGLAIDGLSARASAVRRVNGSVQVTQALSATLTQDPATGDPEAAGKELHEQLEKAGIRERRCTLCLPVSRAFTISSPLPEIPEEDLADLLQLEAERAFPVAPEDLLIGRSCVRLPGGSGSATQVAIPQALVDRFERFLRAAQLTPVSLTLGLPLLERAGEPMAVPALALAVEGCALSLLVTAGGGILSLRTLATTMDVDGTATQLDVAGLLRELRITLGQLPTSVRERLSDLRVVGNAAVADVLVGRLEPGARSLGLRVTRVTGFAPGRFPVSLPSGITAESQIAHAVDALAGRPAELEFLPPRLTTWQKLSARYSSARLLYTGGAVATVVIIVGALFLVQQVQLMQLRSQWTNMAPRVRDLDDMQQQIKRFRPWFDDSVRSLSILRRLAEAFPEDGGVVAKTVELHDSGLVTCGGTARDNAALMLVLERLRGTSEINDVQIDQWRGRSPLQFTFNFHWGTSAKQP